MATGFAETRNVYEVRGTLDGVAAVQLTVVPFATHLHLHLADRSLLSNTTVKLYDGDEVLRSDFSANLMPPFGIPLGSTRRVDIQAEAPTLYRAVFPLIL
jgi:hypothetical protein